MAQNPEALPNLPEPAEPAEPAAPLTSMGADSQFVEHLFEDLTLFRRQVAPGLLFEQREDVNHLRRGVEVRRRLLFGSGIDEIPEMDRRCPCERNHERGE